jgi:hypothetical protein
LLCFPIPPHIPCSDRGWAQARPFCSLLTASIDEKIPPLQYTGKLRNEGAPHVAFTCGGCDRLLLPAAAKGLINLHQGEEFVEPRLRQAEFRGEIVCLVGKHFEVACGAALITPAGKLRGILG